MNKNTLFSVFGAVLLVGALLSGAAGLAAADTTTDEDRNVSVVDEMIYGDAAAAEDPGVLDQVSAAMTGFRGAMEGWVEQQRYDSEEADGVDAAAQSLTESINAQSSAEAPDGAVTWSEYLNSRVTADEDVQIVQVDMHMDGESETRYIIADYNTTDSTYDSVTAVSTTDRDVDRSVTLCGMAADQASEEVDAVVDGFISSDSMLTIDEISRLNSQYGDHVAGDIDGLSDEIDADCSVGDAE